MYPSPLLQLLIEHEDAIAPDPDDSLHSILNDLGPNPSTESLLVHMLGEPALRCYLLMNNYDVNPMQLIRFIDLFTLSCGSNWNEQGGEHFDMSSSSFKCHFGALMWLVA